MWHLPWDGFHRLTEEEQDYKGLEYDPVSHRWIRVHYARIHAYLIPAFCADNLLWIPSFGKTCVNISSSSICGHKDLYIETQIEALVKYHRLINLVEKFQNITTLSVWHGLLWLLLAPFTVRSGKPEKEKLSFFQKRKICNIGTMKKCGYSRGQYHS